MNHVAASEPCAGTGSGLEKPACALAHLDTKGGLPFWDAQGERSLSPVGRLSGNLEACCGMERRCLGARQSHQWVARLGRHAPIGSSAVALQTAAPVRVSPELRQEGLSADQQSVH